jgi:hypothetical protein
MRGAAAAVDGCSHEVARKAEGYFEQDIGNGLLDITADHWSSLIWTAAERIRIQLKHPENPDFVEEFLATISPVFDVSYIHSLKANFAAFDRVAGAPLSDVFIQQKAYPEWIQDLVAESIITYCHSEHQSLFKAVRNRPHCSKFILCKAHSNSEVGYVAKDAVVDAD